MALSEIVRPSTPNTALAAPLGFTPDPDIPTAEYSVPAARLYTAIRAVAGAQSRVFPAADYPDRLQAHYVARTRLMNFPDLIMVQAIAAGPDHARLVIWSRSIYGQRDFGVNQARAGQWIAALNTILDTRTEH